MHRVLGLVQDPNKKLHHESLSAFNVRTPSSSFSIYLIKPSSEVEDEASMQSVEMSELQISEAAWVLLSCRKHRAAWLGNWAGKEVVCMFQHY